LTDARGRCRMGSISLFIRGRKVFDFAQACCAYIYRYRRQICTDGADPLIAHVQSIRFSRNHASQGNPSELHRKARGVARLLNMVERRANLPDSLTSVPIVLNSARLEFPNWVADRNTSKLFRSYRPAETSLIPSTRTRPSPSSGRESTSSLPTL